MTYPFDIVMLPLQILLFVFTMYFFIIGFCGMWRFHEDKITTPIKRFAVLVAAHNEHRVIGQLVENLKELNYPKDLYDIYVIADNCSDNTAKVAEAAVGKGLDVVCKARPDRVPRGVEGAEGQVYALQKRPDEADAEADERGHDEQREPAPDRAADERAVHNGRVMVFSRFFCFRSLFCQVAHPL